MLQQQIDEAWEQQALQQQQMQTDGWGVWPVAPPPYRGFSFRTLFQYIGPSLMDGAEQESNIPDDLQDEWSIYSDIEEAADALINGRQTSGVHFVRARGSSHTVEVRAEEGMSFLQFLWMISFGRYTRCIAGPDAVVPTLNQGLLPLNPLTFFQAITHAIITERCAVGAQLDCLIGVSLCFDETVFIPSEIWDICAVQFSVSGIERGTSLQEGCASST